MNPIDMGKALGDIVLQALAPVIARVDALEKMQNTQPSAEQIAQHALALLPALQNGKDADMDEIKRYLDELLLKHAEQQRPPALDIAPTVEEIAAHFERRFSDLTLAWERQVREATEKALDKIPVPENGKPGRDALELEDFDLSLGEDMRTVTLSLKRGDVSVVKSVRLATVIDRGQYNSKNVYERGDGVSHGSSFWIAQADDPEGAPGTCDDWRLAVKKGRDGRDLRENASRHDPSKGVRIS